MANGLTQFQLSYEISPITLVGGIASNSPGAMVPVISLIQAQDFTSGLLSSPTPLTFNDFVAHFQPMPGSTLIDNQVGEYPFANQAVAANAIITQPLRISLMMIAPAPSNGGYTEKAAALTSLQQTIQQHVTTGGYFIVATPSFTYTTCLLLTIRDVSAGDTLQVQTRWQWDFVQPLILPSQAAAAQGSLMSKNSGGLQTAGDPPAWSGTGNTVGVPGSGIAPPLIPAAQDPGGPGSNVGSPNTGGPLPF